jgi:hypothetical protein
MSDRPEVTDAAIQSMLAARAARARPVRFEPAAIATLAGPQLRRVLPGGGFFRRASVAASAVAVVAVVAVLIAGPLVGRPAASPAGGSASLIAASATGTAPTSSSSPIPPAEVMRVLSPAEAGELIRSRSSRAGSLMAVNGRLEAAKTGSCRTVAECVPVVVAGAGGGFTVRPIGDIGPGPWDGSGTITGTFVLTPSAVIENDVRIVYFVGVLATPPTGGPSWFVQDLLEGAAHVEGSYAAVDGWLVRDPPHPCPSSSRHPAYGCPTDDWLSESAFQPLQPDGSSVGPSAAIALSSGSYDGWAPDPAPFGPGNAGVEPRHGIFLMWLVSDGCGPNADCAAPPPRWRIVGRFDPISSVSAPTPGPSGPVGRFPAASCSPGHYCL